MAGSISSIGIGSGLQLQDILDQLRDVDNQAMIDPKKDLISGYEAQLEEFSVVKNMLFSMKSAALDLSLASTFLGRSVTSSNEDVLTATVADGTAAQSTTLTVTGLAQKSSWMSASGVSDADSIVYVPTSQESSAGVADPAVDVIAATDGTLEIIYGGSTVISVDVGPAAGVQTMDDLVNAINTNAVNITGSGDNGRYVTASTFTVDGSTYLRIETDTAAGTGEANRVAIANNDTDLTLGAPSATFAYSMGGETTSIEVTADTTLSELMSLINEDSDNPGVTASIIDDGLASPYRLVLKADATGEDSRITILSQMPDMVLSEQAGDGGVSLNARFTIDGIPYERQQNSFSDVLSGVTVSLQDEGTATVSVANKDDSVKDMVKALVTAYNDVVQEIRAQIAYDGDTGEFGVLARTTLRDLPYELQKIMTSITSADSSGNIKSMFDLGMQFERDGTITMDEEVLDSVLADNASGVQALFLGDEDAGITGLADQLNDRLRILLASDGQVAAESSAAQTRIDDITLQIEAETERLDKKYDLMTKQFIELDRYMNQMTSVSDYLTSQFDSLSSMWGAGKSSK